MIEAKTLSESNVRKSQKITELSNDVKDLKISNEKNEKEINSLKNQVAIFKAKLKTFLIKWT